MVNGRNLQRVTVKAKVEIKSKRQKVGLGVIDDQKRPNQASAADELEERLRVQLREKHSCSLYYKGFVFPSPSQKEEGAVSVIT
jgi:hypothetical protein